MEMGLGFLYGVVVASVIWVLITLIGVTPQASSIQFHHDCKVMAHGTVSGSLCVKGNTILFHQ